MNIWIVTIGSSDVQLDSDTISRNKGRREQQRSNKVWSYWYDENVKLDCYDIAFEPKQAYKDLDEPYRIEPRVLGMVYESSTPETQKEIWSYLTFPLLDNFVRELENSHPDAIAVLLTDQSEIFKAGHIKRKPKCAYWQDTCTLQPILYTYFKDKFPDVQCQWISLFPYDDKGLADWDSVLKLVGQKLSNLSFDGVAINNEEINTVYVSHQAGTPAISSAVQFASLARFNTKVQFLVSNEYNSELTRPIDSPSYLRGIQMQESKRLLERYDYAGVQQLLRPYLSLTNEALAQRIQSLLAIAVQWNFAEFDDFQQKLQAYNWDKTDIVAERFNHWWWVGYEAAYLAVIRLKQKNTVEALFHSFRAAEGIIAEWAKATYQDYINDNGQSLFVESDIRNVLPNYLNDRQPSDLNPHVFMELREKLIKGRLSLHSASLYELLRVSKPQWKQNEHIEIVWDVAAKRRNQRFHQILGMKELEVFDAWGTNNSQQWEQRVLGCLNFVTEQNFSSLQEVSLMALVHQELKDAIAQYQP